MTDSPAEHAERIAAGLRQGDLLATPVAVVLEAPASSLVEGAEHLATVDDLGIWAPAALNIDSGWTAIVTQTCDVVRAIDTDAHLQLMPIVALEEDEWNDALNGRRGSRFSLPRAEELPIAFPAIDCAISFPVAKAALAHDDVKTLATPLDPAARVLLSHWLMRRVGRHAFPDELEAHVLRPLREKITKSMGKNSRGGQLASGLIGVWSSTEWAPAVSLIFVVDENRLAAHSPGLDASVAVEELIAPIRKHLGRADSVVQIVATPRTLAGVSAFDLLVSHRQVDLDVLPTGNFAATDEIAALTQRSAATSATDAP
jgi:hypothetical protein